MIAAEVENIRVFVEFFLLALIKALDFYTRCHKINWDQFFFCLEKIISTLFLTFARNKIGA